MTTRTHDTNRAPGFKLQWFRAGEEIPHGSRFVKAEKKKVGTKEVWDDFGSFSGWDYIDVVDEFYLYEVPA